MIRLVKTEIHKSIHNKFFALALVFAFIIQLISFLTNLDYVRTAVAFAYKNLELIGPSWRGSNDGMNMYVLWLSEEGYTMGFTLAQFMLPILAVLPFGWSFFSEQRSGYQNHMVSRSSKLGYFTAKYIAVFLSGGAVIAFMLLSNLALCALIGEHGAPRCYTLSTSVCPGIIASELYYTKPMLAALIWTGISSVWAGALAGLTMPAAQLLKRSIFVLLTPFAAVILWDNASRILGGARLSVSDNFFLCTATLDSRVIFVQLLILILVGFGGGLLCCLKKETL